MFTITTLMENRSLKDSLHNEPGISLLVEKEGFRLLYDTGLTARVLMNARSLGKSLSNLDALVLSHGHDDHTGGAAAVILNSKPKKIYIGDGFFDDRFGKRTDGYMDEGSLFLSSMAETVKTLGVSVEETAAAPLLISDGMYLLSGFKEENDIEKIPSGMQRLKDGKLTQDTFTEETVLVLENNGELCIISGCSHVGMLNIIAQTERKMGLPVSMFIGGTHLMEADAERIRKTAEVLKASNIRHLGACHCTGKEALDYFRENLPSYFDNMVGSIVEF